MTSTLTMFDAVTISNLPGGGDAYAGYLGGSWPNYPDVVKRFPGAHHLSIAVNSHIDADCLDIEKGDAAPGDAPVWFARQQRRGVWRPVLYCSQSNLFAVVHALGGTPRSAYRLWSAHTGRGKHFCAPATCGAPVTVDGTQWQQNVAGHDTSILTPGFFGPVAPSGPRYTKVTVAVIAAARLRRVDALTYIGSRLTPPLSRGELLAINVNAPWRHRNLQLNDLVETRTG